MRDTIDMAREAGIDWTDFEINGGFNALKTFEALVRADERSLAAPVQDSTCNNTLRAQGKAYPRTCRKCGLGPCVADRAQPAPVQEIEYCTDYHCAGDCGQPHNEKEMCDFLTAQPAPVQEPWKYRRWNDEAEKWELTDDCGWLSETLYTTPPAQQDIQRLTALVRAQQITIDKLEKALAAPVQEPVAWMYEDMLGLVGVRVQKEKPIVARPVTPLCLCTPPAAQRQWVGLTDEEIRNIGLSLKVDFTWEEFARAIEAKLKENTP